MQTRRPRPFRAGRLISSAIAVTAAMLLGSIPALADAPPSTATSSPASPAVALGIARIAGGLEQPVFITNAGDARLFVVERAGRIRILKKSNASWRVVGTFLDIRGRVRHADIEQGLLGLAFAPDYASSGRFYVYYVNNSGKDVVAEYRRAARFAADPNSERKLLAIPHPYLNHNGGWIAFKGGESNLYIGTGDGGSGGDPGNRAQNTNVLLGKILRINPSDPDGRGPKRYGIPAGNPFVGVNGRDEVYAYGLRNPWRDSFDSLTGDLWIGDVGQDAYEEIDHVASASGKNFGWKELEGRHHYPSGSLCSSNCRTLPVAEYSHADGNCSVTGGYVSRRSGAELYGEYLFGDFCSGKIWHVPTYFDSTTLPQPLNSGLSISTFGVGSDQTVYVADLGGSIYRITGT